MIHPSSEKEEKCDTSYFKRYTFIVWKNKLPKKEKVSSKTNKKSRKKKQWRTKNKRKQIKNCLKRTVTKPD